MSPFQRRQVQLAEARRVSNRFDLDNLRVFDLEGQYQDQASTRCNDDSYRSVHESKL